MIMVMVMKGKIIALYSDKIKILQFKYYSMDEQIKIIN